MISQVISALHGAIMSKNLVVIFKFAKQLPGLLLGDRFRVEHVISNLLSNAIKFSPDGKEIVVDITGVTVRKTAAQPDNDRVSGYGNVPLHMSSKSGRFKHSCIDITIAITDAGCGISPANQVKPTTFDSHPC